MPPKGKAAPKPVEFSISQILAGSRRWLAGESGPDVQLNVEGNPFFDLMGVPSSQRSSTAKRPRKEVILLGKVLFGRQRFAFEVQEVDYSPAEIKKLIAKEKEIEQDRFGCDYDDFQQDRDCPDWLHMFKAKELAPKHSLQIKFDDIVRIDIAGDVFTLHLSSTPACYLKPAGETSRGNMEVGKDITGGAKTFVFFTDSPSGTQSRRTTGSTEVAFSTILATLTEQSPRLAALFRGEPPATPAVAVTPKGKKRTSLENDLLGSSQKRSARASARQGAVDVKFEKVCAAEGTWLKKAVDRFGLLGPVNEQISEVQWKKYYEEREQQLMANHKSDDEANSDEDPDENEGPSVAEVVSKIQKSVRDTVSSSSLALNAVVVARGAVLTNWDCNDAGEGEPRTVSSRARFYSPVANGQYVDVIYENHCRARQSFTERDSYLWARKSGVTSESGHQEGQDNESCNTSRRTQFQRAGFEKLFELDYNDLRKKDKVKTTVATNAVLSSIGDHLFGSDVVLSNRKVFGLLVRCAGLGQFRENNGWPIAVMRRRFKCAKGEQDTDTEKIAGEEDEDPSMGGCCVM